MNLTTFISSYYHDIFIDGISFESINILCSCSRTFYCLLEQFYYEKLSNIIIHVWYRKDISHISVYGCGANNFVTYYNYIINNCIYTKNKGFHCVELDYYWRTYGGCPHEYQLHGNNSQTCWNCCYDEAYCEEDIFNDILESYITLHGIESQLQHIIIQSSSPVHPKIINTYY